MAEEQRNRKALLGRKLGMSQVWDENGFFVPVTLVDVSTNVVTAVKNQEKDGYQAIQIGYGQIDPTKVTKPLAGHFAKAGVTPRRHLVEVRTADADSYQPGQELGLDLLPEGSEVDVTGTTKGKGFAGTIKRWGFKSY
ncbi:MAG: 50S ribosomal protein L3, partial [Bifidobacterium sp.]|nr:50S ribosomal protein L3 [Bifidobacterium sp.]